MKGSDYIKAVFEHLSSDEQIAKASLNGAFLTAALTVIQEVESPLKEETLVKLAALEVGNRRKKSLCGRRAA